MDNESSIYYKISGTFMMVGNDNPSRIYEYGDFSPIPFRPGDIVGIFIPHDVLTRLRVRSEDVSSHFNYYLTLEDFARVSPIEEMDLEANQALQSQQYLPLVSVYITRTYGTIIHKVASARQA